MRALYLSASLGGGHRAAAEAVHEALGGERFFRDYLRYVPAVERWPIVASYWFSLKYWPAFYRWYYHWSNKHPEPPVIARQFGRAGLGALARDLAHLRPDAVISTYPLAAALADGARRERAFAFQNYLIMTDFQAHRHWARPEADRIFVPTEEAYDQLLAFGVPEDRLAATGLPVRRIFLELQAREALKAELGLDERPLVLLNTGAANAYRGRSRAIEALKALDQPLYAVVFSPTEDEANLQEGPVELLIRPVGTAFARYLGAADLVLGKAGGMTLAEALVVGRALLIFEPIPGHEEENAAWIEEKGAGLWAKTASELLPALRRLLGDEAYRMEVEARARALGRPNAAREIAASIRREVGG